jgi:hypothetical protein
MGKSKIEKFLSRRMMTEKGWVFFCCQCGDYKPEKDFYKSKKTHFGVDYKCKLHYRKKNEVKEDDDDQVSHIKIGSITDNDFEQTQILLETLGYKFGPNELPVWQQFDLRHNYKNAKD